jgi:hypothetical protein
MKASFKVRDFSTNFIDQFPDGDYTVGRGADPRGLEEPKSQPAATPKPAKTPPPKKPWRTAAE